LAEPCINAVPSQRLPFWLKRTYLRWMFSLIKRTDSLAFEGQKRFDFTFWQPKGIRLWAHDFFLDQFCFRSCSTKTLRLLQISFVGKKGFAFNEGLPKRPCLQIESELLQLLSLVKTLISLTDTMAPDNIT